IHVTHDQDEALVMSDRIAVMNAGRIEQMDNAENLYERPRTRFVAQFLRSCNLIEGEVESVNGSEFTAATTVGLLKVSGTEGPESRLQAVRKSGCELPPEGGTPNRGEKVTLAIRLEKISLAKPGGAPDSNCISARLENLV